MHPKIEAFYAKVVRRLESHDLDVLTSPACCLSDQFAGAVKHFEEAGCHKSFPCMPFSEACKAMARGIGYAYKGDVLTGAFVGALLRAG